MENRRADGGVCPSVSTSLSKLCQMIDKVLLRRAVVCRAGMVGAVGKSFAF